MDAEDGGLPVIHYKNDFDHLILKLCAIEVLLGHDGIILHRSLSFEDQFRSTVVEAEDDR